DGVEIGNDLAGALECVLCLKLVGYRCAVDECIVEDLLAGVTIECANMIGGRQTQALVGLRHQIADVNLRGWRVDKWVGDAVPRKVRDRAGEGRGGTEGGGCGQG